MKSGGSNEPPEYRVALPLQMLDKAWGMSGWYFIGLGDDHLCDQWKIDTRYCGVEELELYDFCRGLWSSIWNTAFS